MGDALRESGRAILLKCSTGSTLDSCASPGDLRSEAGAGRGNFLALSPWGHPPRGRSRAARNDPASGAARSRRRPQPRGIEYNRTCENHLKQKVYLPKRSNGVALPLRGPVHRSATAPTNPVSLPPPGVFQVNSAPRSTVGSLPDVDHFSRASAASVATFSKLSYFSRERSYPSASARVRRARRTRGRPVLGEPLLERGGLRDVIGQPHQVLHPIGVTLDRVLGGLGERPQLLTVLPFEAGSDTSITPLTDRKSVV